MCVYGLPNGQNRPLRYSIRLRVWRGPRPDAADIESVDGTSREGRITNIVATPAAFSVRAPAKIAKRGVLPPIGVHGQSGPVFQGDVTAVGAVGLQERACETGLWVHIDKMDSPCVPAQQHTQRGGGGCLGRASLLIGSCDDLHSSVSAISTSQRICHQLFWHWVIASISVLLALRALSVIRVEGTEAVLGERETRQESS